MFWYILFYKNLQQTFVGLQNVLKTSSRYVLKTSSTCLQRNNFTSFKTSWRRLEDVFKTYWKIKNCYAEDVFKTSWRHVLKTSWRHVLKTCFEDMSWRHVLKTSWRHTLKTSLRHVLKTSWRLILKMPSRRPRRKKNVYWWYLYLTNLNVYLTNLCFTNLYLTNLGQMHHLEPNNFDIRLILKHTSISILRIKTSKIDEWASEARKTKI